MTGATGNGQAGDGARAPDPETSPATALVPYLRAIRVHLWLVIAIALTTTVATGAWLWQKEPQYEAEAKILVSPLPDDDPSFVGLPLVRAVGADSTRAVRTAASLIHSPAATRRTARQLGLSEATVDAAVDVLAEEESNLVDVRATSTNATEAATLANTYAQAALDARRTELGPLVRAQKLRLRRELDRLPDPASSAAQLTRVRLSGLKSIQNGKDPTLSISREADVPDAPIGIPRWQVMLLAIVGGTTLGIAVALLMQILAPRRIADEGDLKRIYPLPVLARVPWVPRRGRVERALDSGRERFRALRLQLMLAGTRAGEPTDARDRGTGALVVVTSGTRGDGRTSTVLNLASACAGARQTAIVVDLDLRKPELARRLGLEGEDGLEAVRRGDIAAEPEIARVRSIRGLAAVVGPAVSSAAELESMLLAIPRMLDWLRTLADWVIVDTPPLTDATIGLPILDQSDHSLIVVRPDNTREEDLLEVRELVEARGVVPAGYVVIGERGGAVELGATARRGREPTATPLG